MPCRRYTRRDGTTGYRSRHGWYERFENNGWRPIVDRALVDEEPSISGSQSRHAEPFHHQPAVRKEERLRKQKLRKREWLMKLYGGGAANQVTRPSCTSCRPLWTRHTCRDRVITHLPSQHEADELSTHPMTVPRCSPCSEINVAMLVVGGRLGALMRGATRGARKTRTSWSGAASWTLMHTCRTGHHWLAQWHPMPSCRTSPLSCLAGRLKMLLMARCACSSPGGQHRTVDATCTWEGYVALRVCSPLNIGMSGLWK
jgi:hypothetical protein